MINDPAINLLVLILSFIGGYYFYIFTHIIKKIWKNAIIAHDNDLPKYVIMVKDKKDNGTELRFRYNDYNEIEYWRDAGIWGVGYRWEQRGLKRVLVSDASDYNDEIAKRLDGMLLIPITEDEYLKGNEGYVPYYYKEEAKEVV